MKRKKKSKKKYIVIAMIIAFVIAVGFIAWQVIGQMRVLSREANKILQMDVENDYLDTNIYTDGDYGVVEATMKSYVMTYMYRLKEFINTNNDDRLSSILGIENLKNDSPDFTESLKYIEDKRNAMQSLEKELESLGTEERIMEVFEGTGLNRFFRWIYRREMLENISLDFFYPASELRTAMQEMEKSLDSKKAVLEYLISCQGKWEIEEDALQFETDELLNGYKKVIAAVS